MLDIVKFIMDTFGFEYTAEVSTKPEKSVGSDADWELATKALMTALEEWGLPYQINEGDGAFYGPKIDIKVKDAIGRIWQLLDHPGGLQQSRSVSTSPIAPPRTPRSGRSCCTGPSSARWSASSAS